MKTFYSYTFGCRVNEAEKQTIDKKMIEKGFIFDEKNPDIYIINTCSVTHKAEREARQLIYKIKKTLPKTKIVVTGCSATYWLKNNLYQNLKLDLIIDNVNKDYLVEIIQKRLGQSFSNRVGYPGVATSKFLKSKRVMIKIQDGCQRYCSFCIVPYLRGMPKSEKIENLKLKIQNLDSSIKEVILTAINTQAFGYDTGESFVDLLRTIIDETQIPRISLGSIHPWSLTDDFFHFYQKYKDKKRLIDFFHIPIQSGSDKILTLMKRGYKKEEIKEKLFQIKKINPLAFLATDIIVGFLEENDYDFEDTYNFLKESPISKFHVFRFSKRAKTQADYLSKRLTEPSPKIKEKRSKILRKLSEEKYSQFLSKNVGRISSVLFLEKKIDNFKEGLTDNQLPILVFDDKKIKSGEIKNVKITEFKEGKLFGKVI